MRPDMDTEPQRWLGGALLEAFTELLVIPRFEAEPESISGVIHFEAWIEDLPSTDSIFMKLRRGRTRMPRTFLVFNT